MNLLGITLQIEQGVGVSKHSFIKRHNADHQPVATVDDPCENGPIATRLHGDVMLPVLPAVAYKEIAEFFVVIRINFVWLDQTDGTEYFRQTAV